MASLVVHHIPVCPFCQRLEILLERKGLRGAVEFRTVDITVPRSPELLAKTRGSTSLPVLVLPDGRVLRESLVLLEYLEAVFPERPVAAGDPYRRAVEQMMCRMEGNFTAAGYRFVMNQDLHRRDVLRDAMLAEYARLGDFLHEHSTAGPYLFEDFGWAETVFTPFFMRFWFLEYYEGFSLPRDGRYARVQTWIEACLAHPDAQQVTKEEIVKTYYDYAKGAGNGALLPGRTKSSFVFEPPWKQRPWPPSNKYDHDATDVELGL